MRTFQLGRDIFLAVAFCAVSAYGQGGTTSLVAIDVGHSHVHPGAISARGKTEFGFNVELARVIRDTLDAKHVRTVLIGEDGAMVDLEKRAAAAEASGATFFLSVHHDSAQPKYFQTWNWEGVERHFSDHFSGYSLFVSRANPEPAISLRCARMIGAALKRGGLSPSAHHAENITGESREWADQNAGVYYFDDLVVLKTAKSPAVLLEAGLIVNRTEENKLQEAATRDAIATAVLQGLSDCGATP